MQTNYALLCDNYKRAMEISLVNVLSLSVGASPSDIRLDFSSLDVITNIASSFRDLLSAFVVTNCLLAAENSVSARFIVHVQTPIC